MSRYTNSQTSPAFRTRFTCTCAQTPLPLLRALSPHSFCLSLSHTHTLLDFNKTSLSYPALFSLSTHLSQKHTEKDQALTLESTPRKRDLCNSKETYWSVKREALTLESTPALGCPRKPSFRDRPRFKVKDSINHRHHQTQWPDARLISAS
jgi:hypothetical protein